MDYKEPYLVMSRAATDALEFLQDRQERLARSVLMMAQWEAERLIASQSRKENEVKE